VACVSADGTLTPSAIAMLRAASAPASSQEIAAAASLPVFRVRAAARELAEAGLLEALPDGRYVATDVGRERLERGR